MRFLPCIALAATLPLAAVGSPAQTAPPGTAAAGAGTTGARSANDGGPPPGFAAEVRLWPGKAPLALGSAPEDTPRLYTYPAPGPGVHPGVVVLPGGGYVKLVNEKEGAAEARWLNARGISAFVLQYRLSPRYHYPVPMLDGLRAMRVVRAHATEWNLRPDAIGVWGFSAGGHLAGFLATADPHLQPTLDTAATGTAAPDPTDALSAHPDFAILTYARLSLDPSIPGTFGMETLTGPNPSQAVLDAISPILHVTAQSSPSFLYATEQDKTVSPLNATLFFNALERAGVPAELHVFEFGGHGSGMGNGPHTPSELAIWPLLLEHWMQAHGWIAETAAP